MYSTREALAYAGKLPDQLNKAAVTPQLLDLLAIQKVESDKRAAAQQLAMANGQPQPTVAQALQQRVLESAKQDVLKQMAGQQGQAGIGAPQRRSGGIVPFAGGGEVSDAPPEMSPEDAAFKRNISDILLKEVNRDPVAEAQTLAESQKQALAASRQAILDQQRQRQAGLQALYERQAKERPSDLDVALRRMARNIHQPGGLGAALQGVGDAITTARQGYTTQDIANLTALSDIDAAIATAIANNDLNDYNALVKEKQRIESLRSEAIKQGATVADVNERVIGRRQSVYDTNQQRREAAQAIVNQRKHEADLAAQLKREAMQAKNSEEQRDLARQREAKSAADETRRQELEFKRRVEAIKFATANDPLFSSLPEDEQEARIQTYMKRLTPLTNQVTSWDQLAKQAKEVLATRKPTLTGGR